MIRAHREFARALAALSALLGAAAMAAAADLDPGPAVSERQVEPAPRPWTVSFMPYAWLTGLNGHTTVKGRTTDIDADPIEVLEHLGGFDAGSTFSWNVLGAFSWQFATHAGVSYSGVLGYRALAVDFDKGSGTSRYEFDAVQHGPLIGLTASF